MYKKIVLAVILMLCVVFMASCSKTEATKNVEALIENIGELSSDSKKAVNEALKAYNALSDEEKEKVDNYSELESKKAALDEADGFGKKLKKLLKNEDNQFTDSKDSITDILEEAKELSEEYEAMSEAAKGLVDTDGLKAFIEKFEKYVVNAEDAAKAYIKAFNQVFKGKKYTVTAIYCIKQIRDNGDEYHMFALKYKDKNKKTHTVYSNARFMSSAAYDLIVEKADIFFAEEPASESSDPVKNANLKLDIEALK
ncbi:MAG: hypothetical protein IKJ88_01105 [Clostridia bacterium]|nr:hypothetical protein [Clostridia bacterium]